jgi:hypothetical protein
MNPLTAAWTILGTIATFLTFGALKTPPDASQTHSQPIVWDTYQPYSHGEIPVAVLPTTTTTTTPATTTTIWREPKPKSECERHLQIALDVGWPANQLATLARVMWRESRCSFGPVLNPNDPLSGSYGVTQINGYWCHPTKSRPQPWLQQRGIITECVDLYGAETNLRAALAIYNNSGWHPWAIK